MAGKQARAEPSAPDSQGMRKEYEFRDGIRGKYASRLRGRSAISVVLDPDVAAAFPDSRSVNDALRVLVRAGEAAARRARRAG